MGCPANCYQADNNEKYNFFHNLPIRIISYYKITPIFMFVILLFY